MDLDRHDSGPDVVDLSLGRDVVRIAIFEPHSEHPAPAASRRPFRGGAGLIGRPRRAPSTDKNRFRPLEDDFEMNLDS